MMCDFPYVSRMSGMECQVARNPCFYGLSCRTNVRRMSGGVLPRKQEQQGRDRREGNYDVKVHVAQEGGVYSIGQY